MKKFITYDNDSIWLIDTTTVEKPHEEMCVFKRVQLNSLGTTFFHADFYEIRSDEFDGIISVNKGLSRFNRCKHFMNDSANRMNRSDFKSLSRKTYDKYAKYYK